MVGKRQQENVEIAEKRCRVDSIRQRWPWMQQVLDNDPLLTSLEINPADNISNDAATALAIALRDNTTLKRFFVMGDGITDETCVALAGAIRVNSTMERITLDSGSITDKTGIAFAEALRENTTLRSFALFSRHPKRFFFGSKSDIPIEDAHLNDLENDRSLWMTDCTARAMVETIRVNSTLQHLDIAISRICEDTAAAVAQALKANVVMQRFSFNGRDITSEGLGPTVAKRNADARRKANAMIRKVFPGVR